MDQCYYTTIVGQAYGVSKLFPSLLSWFLWIYGRISSELGFTLYGLFLWFWQVALWVFQIFFESTRADPICQFYQTYSFPSIPIFYGASLVTALIMYSIQWDTVMTTLTWILLYFVAFAPPVIVYYTAFNQWWEILISFVLGVVATILFVIMMRVYIKPMIPYLLTVFPCTTLGYIDTYMMDENDRVTYVVYK